SARDPSVLPNLPILSKWLRLLGPWFWGPMLRFGKWASRSWAEPWYRLRAELGLPPVPENPLTDNRSPALDLALFSKLLAGPQPDWPPQTVQTGFPFYDAGDKGLSLELTRFLDAGPPPVVFTLGWSAATVAGRFFENSLAAAKLLGRRGVLITGKGAHN